MAYKLQDKCEQVYGKSRGGEAVIRRGRYQHKGKESEKKRVDNHG